MSLNKAFFPLNLCLAFYQLLLIESRSPSRGEGGLLLKVRMLLGDGVSNGLPAETGVEHMQIPGADAPCQEQSRRNG